MRLTSSQPRSSGILISCVPARIALVVLRLPHWACLARGETDLRHHRDALEPTSNGSSLKHPRRCAQASAHHQNLAILAADQRLHQSHAESTGLVFRHVRNPPARLSKSNNFMRGFKE
jgi:hypothetical protein